MPKNMIVLLLLVAPHGERGDMVGVGDGEEADDGVAAEGVGGVGSSDSVEESISMVVDEMKVVEGPADSSTIEDGVKVGKTNVSVEGTSEGLSVVVEEGKAVCSAAKLVVVVVSHSSGSPHVPS